MELRAADGAAVTGFGLDLPASKSQPDAAGDAGVRSLVVSTLRSCKAARWSRATASLLSAAFWTSSVSRSGQRTRTSSRRPVGRLL